MAYEIEKIVLSESRDARHVEASAQFYMEEVLRVMDLTQEVVATARAQPPDEPWDYATGRRRHQNIGILGCRGAGKTSILLSYLRLLQDAAFQVAYDQAATGEADRGTFAQKWKDLPAQVDIGCLIEPSLLETGDHVVATVYASLLHRAQRYLLEHPPRTATDESRAEALMRCDEEVTRYLPALLSKGLLEDAFVARGTEGLHEELVRHRSGYSLERALWEFVDAYLALRGKDVLVLAFDDVDLAEERCHEVLDSLRRYLTSRRVINVVTGDPRLFSWMMRQRDRRQMVELALGSMQRDAGDFTAAEQMIDDKVEQYLKKVFPPHMRVMVPELRAARFRRAIIHKEQHQAEGKTSTPGSAQAATAAVTTTASLFSRRFSDVLRCCLRETSRGGARERSTDAEMRPSDWESFLTHSYQYLVPKDARHLVELCSMEDAATAAAADGVGSYAKRDEILLAFASVWRADLVRYGLSVRQLRELIDAPQVGLRVLNLLMRHPGIHDVALRLDPRTDDPRLNVALAFLRFALEAVIDRLPSPPVVTLGLELFVPAHYLARQRSPQLRAEAWQAVEAQLMDSHRRFYQRLVPWIARGGAVQPGVVRLVERAGALENLLDLHQSKPTAIWRRVLGDPERVRFPLAQKEAVKRCREALLAAKRGSPGSSSVERGVDAPGARWATRYLPWACSLKKSGRSHPEVVEMAPSADMFHDLAGALPLAVLHCWMVEDVRHSYLSPWQGLSLLQRIVHRCEGVEERSTCEREEWMKGVHRAVLAALNEHLGERGVSTALSDEGRGSRTSGIGEGDMAELAGDPAWKQYLDELRRADDPWSLFPDPENGHFVWKTPHPKSLDDRSSLGTDGRLTGPADPAKPRSHASWTLDKACFKWTTSAAGTDRSPPRLTRLNLQATRLDAWEFVLGRLAMAITEWWDYWRDLFREERDLDGRRLRPGLDQVQKLFNVFLESTEMDLEFVGQNSGAGDIIQRWVLYFLNSVLVETLQGPSDPKVQRPQLVRYAAVERPARRGQTGQGADHPLYENLTHLLDAARNAGKETEVWTWSPIFLALASFPPLALFLPGGGALPVVKEVREALSKEESDTWSQRVYFHGLKRRISVPSAGDDLMTELETLVSLGALMLIPLPPYPAEEDNTQFLDLAGLSWAGLDLCERKSPEKNESPWPLSLWRIEDRRAALIEMLNCLHADLEPCEEARPYAHELALIVRRMLKEEAEKVKKANT
ncbi:MAG: hypothetical protein ABIO70_15805 [Pseudomonadota bacterium]